MQTPHLPQPTRRQFLQTGLSALIGAGVAPNILLSNPNRPSPANRITLGVIGCGNQGMNDALGLMADPRVQVVAVCDPNKRSNSYWSGMPGGRDYAKWYIDDEYKKEIRSGKYDALETYVDYREMLQREDIDAILISTPDHWHCLQAVDAAWAGKDIYCQKPLSLTVHEGRVMSDVVRQTGVVFQTGSQQRSNRFFTRAVGMIGEGRFGKIKKVRVGLLSGRRDYTGKMEDRKLPEPIPEGFDYEMWLGPAPRAPYAPARCHINFRWIFDYAGGQVTDWGAHHIDCAQWGLGEDLGGPVEFYNFSGVFPPDPLWDTATEFHFEARYADGTELVVSDKERFGVVWEGEDGWIHANRGELNFQFKGEAEPTSEKTDDREGDRNAHYRNFIDCVVSRKETNAPAEIGHRSASVCHLGNIGLRLGRESIRWDPVDERVIGDPGAQDMLRRPYRSPWKYPEA